VDARHVLRWAGPGGRSGSGWLGSVEWRFWWSSRKWWMLRRLVEGFLLRRLSASRAGRMAMVMESLLCVSAVQRDQYAQLWWRLAVVTLYMREQQAWKTSLRRKVGPIGMEDCSWKRRILRGRRVLRCNFFCWVGDRRHGSSGMPSSLLQRLACLGMRPGSGRCGWVAGGVGDALAIRVAACFR
jgi:hypothetical protein